MPTYVITKELIEEKRQLLDKVKALAEEGDDVATLALDAIALANALGVELRGMTENVEHLTSLVFAQSELIERIVAILGAMDMRVPMPECPEDLMGYG